MKEPSDGYSLSQPLTTDQAPDHNMNMMKKRRMMKRTIKITTIITTTSTITTKTTKQTTTMRRIIMKPNYGYSLTQLLTTDQAPGQKSTFKT